MSLTQVYGDVPRRGSGLSTQGYAIHRRRRSSEVEQSEGNVIGGLRGSHELHKNVHGGLL